MLIAPSYDEASLEVLGKKPNTRVLEDGERRIPDTGEPEVKQVTGGLLMQDGDSAADERDSMEVVTEREPTEREWADALFAWRVCRHVRSNAIVLAAQDATIGIGAGQMSRVDSVRIAIDKCRSQEMLKGATMASDAFFPFSDGPELAFDAGITAVIQPGGSVRDDEVIAAANKAGVAMIFTKRRHFRH